MFNYLINLLSKPAKLKDKNLFHDYGAKKWWQFWRQDEKLDRVELHIIPRLNYNNLNQEEIASLKEASENNQPGELNRIKQKIIEKYRIPVENRV